MLRALRILLLFDAAVLFVLGGGLVAAPGEMAQVFRFEELPAGAHLILGLWGCVLVTTGLGYAIAAQDPARHVAWVQVGIARGALECLVGLLYVLRGVVTFQQAGVGIVLGGLIALAYLALYPREEGTELSQSPIPNP